MDGGSRIGTADRGPTGPAHPPRSYPGNERRELPPQAEQTQERPAAQPLIRQPLPRTHLGEENVFRYGLNAPPCRRRRPSLQPSSSPTIPDLLRAQLVYFYSAALVYFYSALDSTGIAMAMLFCTGVSAICRLIIGIIADMEPKTAKHRA